MPVRKKIPAKQFIITYISSTRTPGHDGFKMYLRDASGLLFSHREANGLRFATKKAAEQVVADLVRMYSQHTIDTLQVKVEEA